MAVAQGSCPGCGAPIQFAVGSSVSTVCTYCHTTVRRTDRGLDNLGKIADLVNTPTLVAVGDSGTLGGQSFVILGRVQLNHDMGGVWDEWYIGYANGAWGWLAYAQGQYYATWKVEPTPAVPARQQLYIEAAVPLGQAYFRVVELKQATIASAEGELPFSPRTGQPRIYADLVGPNRGFATLDWGEGGEACEVFLGNQLDESQLQITQQVERPGRQVDLQGINCPNCGAPIRLHAGQRIERVACQHCGAISESASQQVIAKQEAVRAAPLIALGSFGSIGDVIYTVIGFVERSTVVDGETFSWTEYLLFAPGLGFRWIVDDEGTWRFVVPLNLADVDLRQFPQNVNLGGRRYSMRNTGTARVTYVVGEFYWKIAVGETVQVSDYAADNQLISREAMQNEVSWSYSRPIPWGVIQRAFGVQKAPPASSGQSAITPGQVVIWVVLIVIILVISVSFSTCITCVGGATSGGGVRGGGYSGGGWSGGK